MGDQNEDFRVIDKRGARKEEKPKEEKQKDAAGEGFTMKETPEHGPSEIDFSTLVFSFATSAMINLGLAPDPMTKKTEKNLELAKQNIDILSILQEKTRNNLTPDEKTLLENLLTEVRLRFVEASKK
jgi:hypothetical protein